MSTTNLHRGHAAKSPESRARSLAGLKRGTASHGAYSAALREPLEQQHRERLRRAYTNAPDDLVNSQAKRLAMVDLLGSWTADNGVMFTAKGRPDVAPAARELRMLLDAADRATGVLEVYAASTHHGEAERALRVGRGELPAGDEDDASDADVVEDHEGER